MSVDIFHQPDGLTIVTLNNPARRNALSQQMFRDLAALWPMLDDRPETRCVVLTGAGEAFCSGADLSQALIELDDIDSLIDGALMKSALFSKPLIAAINGACVAGGFELALASDIRICSETARLGLPEARWGIFPAGGGATRLAGAIGLTRATDLLLSGRLITATEALQMGFVTQVTAPEALLDTALAAARRIAANSPTVVRAIKRYLHAARHLPADLGALERELTRATRQSADARIGAAAFLDKGPAAYPD